MAEPEAKRQRTEEGETAAAGPSTGATAPEVILPPAPPPPAPEVEHEEDAPASKAATIKDAVTFHTHETTLNVLPGTHSGLLKTISDGGFQYLIGAARGNAGLKAGRYMFEAKIVEFVNPVQDSGKGGGSNKQVLRVGFSTGGRSSLFLGETDESVCFDMDGFFTHNKTRKAVGQRTSRDVVMAVVLNLNETSPNADTVSLFRNGVRAGPPQPLPENLKGKPLFPAVCFKNTTVFVNFGPQPQMPLPFKCRMVQDAEQKHAVVTPAAEVPKDGKHQVVFPVCLPDEGTFDWADMWLEKNPDFTELSDRMILDWAEKSGIPRAKGYSARMSLDKPEMAFNLPFMDDGSVRHILQQFCPIQRRNFLVLEVKGNLVDADRKELHKLWPAALFKRVAKVLVGEPAPDFRRRTGDLILAEKQTASNDEWKKLKVLEKAKKAQERVKKVLEKKQRKIHRGQRNAEKERLRAIEKLKKARAEAEAKAQKEAVERERQAKKAEAKAQKAKAKAEEKAKATARKVEEKAKRMEERLKERQAAAANNAAAKEKLDKAEGDEAKAEADKHLKETEAAMAKLTEKDEEEKEKEKGKEESEKEEEEASDKEEEEEEKKEEQKEEEPSKISDDEQDSGAEEEPVEDEMEEDPPQVELSAEQKSIWFRKKPISDLTSYTMNTTFMNFSLPVKEDGFDQISYDWAKTDASSQEYLRQWILNKKHTTRIEDLVPSKWFSEEWTKWQKQVQAWHLKQNEHKGRMAKQAAEKQQKAAAALNARRLAEQVAKLAGAKTAVARDRVEKAEGEEAKSAAEKELKEAEDAEAKAVAENEKKEHEKQGEEQDKGEEKQEKKIDLDEMDLFGFEDVNDIGDGSPLCRDFGFEDWTVMSLRYEMQLLAHAFAKDANDLDRTGIHTDHLGFYYQKYYKKPLNLQYCGVEKTEDLVALVDDSVGLKSSIITSKFPEQLESLSVFMMLTEEDRRQRNLRVDMGEDDAKLKIVQQQQAGQVVPPPQFVPGAAKGHGTGPYHKGDGKDGHKGYKGDHKGGHKGWDGKGWDHKGGHKGEHKGGQKGWDGKGDHKGDMRFAVPGGGKHDAGKGWQQHAGGKGSPDPAAVAAVLANAGNPAAASAVAQALLAAQVAAQKGKGKDAGKWGKEGGKAFAQQNGKGGWGK